MFKFLWWLTTLLLFGPPLLLLRLWTRFRLGARSVLRISLSQSAHRASDFVGDVDETVELLRQVVNDPRVRGVIVDVRDVGGGQASLQDLHDTLLALRNAGRTVMVHTHGFSWKELLVASAADRVWMTPSGEVFLTGMGARLTYFGPALDRIGVKADFVAVGRFKTFGEPYLRGHPSRANREQLQELLGDLQDQTIERVARARNIRPLDLRALLGRAPLSADDALAAGLVDGVCYPDESSNRAVDLLGDGWRLVPGRVYQRLDAMQRWLSSWFAEQPSIAVVHLDGPIVQGSEGMSARGPHIDSDAVVPVLVSLASDESVRGVVLAVNSPGGSALASDLIARAVQQLGMQKPVVAAFGDVSASGGYYLSAPASEVIARPGTVTGSIGVVGGKVVVGNALARFGVHSETVSVGPDAGFLGPDAPFDASQRVRFQSSLNRAYERFLGIVSAGRRLPVRAVEPHAAGRVWTGRQALERGLVDHLGGLDLAVERVALKASLSPDAVSLAHIHFRPSRLAMLSTVLSGGVARWVSATVEDVVLARMGAGGLLVRYAWSHPEEPMALLPWDIEDV